MLQSLATLDGRASFLPESGHALAPVSENLPEFRSVFGSGHRAGGGRDARIVADDARAAQLKAFEPADMSCPE